MSVMPPPALDDFRPSKASDPSPISWDLGPSRSARKRRGPGKLIGVLAGLVVVAAVAYFGWDPVFRGSEQVELPLLGDVLRGTFRVVVSEKGSLESTVTVDGVCELNGYQNKIIQLVAEGSQVNKGDIVCRFDSSEIDKNIAQQEIKSKQALSKIETSQQEREIQKNKGQSEITAAKVELELASLDLVKYIEGDYPAEIEEIRGSIAQQEKDLEETRNKMDKISALVKRGFKTPEDLRFIEKDYERFSLQKSRDLLKLKVKEKFEYQRKTTELTSKKEQSTQKVEQAKATAKAGLAKADSEFQAAVSTSRIEEQQLKELVKQKEKTFIKAEQPGIVAYANEPWYDSSRQIREGAMVHFRQKIFSLPDLTRMQVKVNVHESLVKKIKVGQKAEIRIEAFPDLVLVGTVKTISNLADSNRGWMSGAKEYSTIVTVDKMPKEDLKPGMTTQVKILAAELSGVLFAPIQAVAENKGEYFAYPLKGDKLQRAKVKIGETNDTATQILEGLQEGDRVALDARNRLAAELKAEETSAPGKAAATKDGADKKEKPETKPEAKESPEPAPKPTAKVAAPASLPVVKAPG